MRRALALAGVVLILAMYITTFILGMMKSPATDGLFKAAVFCTLTVPILLYGYQLVYKYLKKRNDTIVSTEKDNEKSTRASKK